MNYEQMVKTDNTSSLTWRTEIEVKILHPLAKTIMLLKSNTNRTSEIKNIITMRERGNMRTSPDGKSKSKQTNQDEK